MGSVRVVNKNLKPLLGKPLLYHTIVEAKKAKLLSRLVVNTDGDAIADYAKSLGVEVYRRPPALGADVDTSEVLQEQVYRLEKQEKYKPQWVVCLQPTSPMRIAEDIDKCVQKAIETKTHTVFTYSLCKQHPYWCFELGRDGQLVNAMQQEMCGDILISQNLPTIVYPTGAVYVTRREWIMAGRIYGEHLIGVSMPSDRAIDLETEMDFLIAETLMRKMKFQNGEKRVLNRVVGVFK